MDLIEVEDFRYCCPTRLEMACIVATSATNRQVPKEEEQVRKAHGAGVCVCVNLDFGQHGLGSFEQIFLGLQPIFIKKKYVYGNFLSITFLSSFKKHPHIPLLSSPFLMHSLINLEF